MVVKGTESPDAYFLKAYKIKPFLSVHAHMGIFSLPYSREKLILWTHLQILKIVPKAASNFIRLSFAVIGRISLKTISGSHAAFGTTIRVTGGHWKAGIMFLKRRIFTIRKLLESRNKLPEEDNRKDFTISKLLECRNKLAKEDYRKDFTISKLLESRNKLAKEDYWKDFHN